MKISIKHSLRKFLKARLLLILILLILVTGLIVPDRAQQKDKFVYWGGLIFSDDANKLFVQKIQEWGQKKGIDVEVVMINQNETVQKVSAAIEAGTMPDALDLGYDLTLLLSKQKKLEALDSVYNDIGKAHGGWFDFANTLVTGKDFGGSIYGNSYGRSGNFPFFRHDDFLWAR